MAKAKELPELVESLAARYLTDLDAVIIERDDQAGRIVAEIPDAATVEYRLRIVP